MRRRVVRLELDWHAAACCDGLRRWGSGAWAVPCVRTHSGVMFCLVGSDRRRGSLIGGAVTARSVCWDGSAANARPFAALFGKVGRFLEVA